MLTFVKITTLVIICVTFSFSGHHTTKSVRRSVVSTSLRPHGLQHARLFCPWDSPGKNTRVGIHPLLQGNLPNPGLPHCRQILYHLSHQEIRGSDGNHQGFQIHKVILRTKIKVSHLLISKHITRGIKAVRYWHRNRYITLTTRIKSLQVNSWKSAQMKFTKVLRQQNRARVVSSTVSSMKTYRKITHHISDKELILKINNDHNSNVKQMKNFKE